MQNRVNAFVDSIEADVIAHRRNFHRYPELGWHEIRTASLIARQLAADGIPFKLGREVFKEDDRMGLPSQQEMDANYQRALVQGADPEYAPLFKDGFTGIVATIGSGDGPTIALRFDIDALPIEESTASDHFPTAQGFASENQGIMHSCGHDGHAAIGLGVCKTLKHFEEQLKAPVKIFFQPAEEGVRGGKAMASSGELEGIQYLIAGHLSSKEGDNGYLSVKSREILATTKLDAVFTGKSAHAGAAPQDGKNALLAASTAILNIHAIPRHAGGYSVANVGKVTAGTMRNGICSDATLLIETRGHSTAINDYLEANTLRILKAAAEMYDCELSISYQGSAESCECDDELADIARQVALEIPEYIQVVDNFEMVGSEDATYLMNRVKQQGGKATYMTYGSLGGMGHHKPHFDIDESDMVLAVKLFSGMALRIQTS
ncbi:amidohydrolase [Parendozoicomonas haliclonae]|uniref:Indole-3-acetyl-aspartic acid hydrolase n=1 Tax=Parendozoicomonas haliclonae TaxID=1960125 RepID=A0A1X7ALV4_9GAMM|nr:amidohydrolase [Parendozoicomonas haliclonae]SMA48757.1 Indole-3-acetyl-aspartic acid hydrolase [Parendozoicomonas haliclonae]